MGSNRIVGHPRLAANPIHHPGESGWGLGRVPLLVLRFAGQFQGGPEAGILLIGHGTADAERLLPQFAIEDRIVEAQAGVFWGSKPVSVEAGRKASST